MKSAREVLCILGWLVLVATVVSGRVYDGHLGQDRGDAEARHEHSSALCHEYEVPPLASKKFFGDFLNSARLVGFGCEVGPRPGDEGFLRVRFFANIIIHNQHI